jgi:predicted ATP-dependent protease
LVEQKQLKPFHASAVSEIIDQSSRIAEDNEKLSTHLSSIEDLIVESDYWAATNKKNIVNATDVKTAIAAQIHRADRSKHLYNENIQRGFIIIKTEGKAIGQVNCLSVRRVGNFSYGHPTRVTARVRYGANKFIDIQREIKLAGPLHAKAGLILSNFLASRFTTDTLFALSASISFEQVYCWTDGDSASVGELCALLSALAKVPLYQHLAITGSIDQYGKVQAVGGVNEKIEGFYDVCDNRKLTGKQGVIIPAVNIKNLMLKEEIVEAVKAKKFHIYAIKSIDQAISLLTGLNYGKRNKDGLFPQDSVYFHIEENLKKFAVRWKPW